MSLKIKKRYIDCFLCNAPVKSLITHFRNRHQEYKIMNRNDLEKTFNYSGDIKVCDEVCCPFCEKYISTNVIERHILYKHGDKNYKTYLEMKDKDRNNIIKCPICNQSFNNILSHIKIHEEMKHIKTKKQLEEFIGCKINNTQVENSKNNLNIQCPYCSKILCKYNAFKMHIKNIHKDRYEEFLNNVDYYDSLYKSNYNKITLKKQKCFICEKLCGDLKQHINRSHYDVCTWDEYCNMYNVNNNSSKICNKDYVIKVFKNQNNFLKYNKRGIHCYYKNIHFKSLLEITVYLMLEDNNLSQYIIYEPDEYIINWFDSNNKEHFYFPDFYDKNTNTIIEVKPENKNGIILTKKETIKINTAMNSFNNLGIKFIFGSIQDIADFYNILDYKKYYSKSYLYNRFRNLYKEELLEFACSENSFTVKRITGKSNLRDLKGIKLYGND